MSRLTSKTEKVEPWRSRTKALTTAKVWKESQSWRSVEHFVMQGAQGIERVRIRFRIDFYPEQSNGNADLFDPRSRSWNTVATLAGQQLDAGSKYCSTAPSFYQDSKELLSTVAAIIGNPPCTEEELVVGVGSSIAVGATPITRMEDMWVESVGVEQNIQVEGSL